MRILFTITFILSAILQSHSQDTTKIEPGKKGFGVSVEQILPEFPGGDDSLQAFLKQNIAYPRDAKINRVQGRVYIGFLVDKKGKIANPKVLSSASKELDEEAMRVVKIMPEWKPGTKGGSAVDVQYILPIDFITPPLQEK